MANLLHRYYKYLNAKDPLKDIRLLKEYIRDLTLIKNIFYYNYIKG